MALDTYVENLERQNHESSQTLNKITIGERYNNARVRGNNLELRLRQSTVTIEKLFVYLSLYVQ